MGKELEVKVANERLNHILEIVGRSCTCEKVSCDEEKCLQYLIRQAAEGEPTNWCSDCDEPIPGIYDDFIAEYCEICAQERKLPVCECGVRAGTWRDKSLKDKPVCPECQGDSFDEFSEYLFILCLPALLFLDASGTSSELNRVLNLWF